MIYSLSDLNFMGAALDREFNGRWETIGGADDIPPVVVLDTGAEEVWYIVDGRYWAVFPESSSATAHRRVVEKFLVAIGINVTIAEATASRVVADRRASGRSCLGPGRLELFTEDRGTSGWRTYFTPITGELYDGGAFAC